VCGGSGGLGTVKFLAFLVWEKGGGGFLFESKIVGKWNNRRGKNFDWS